MPADIHSSKDRLLVQVASYNTNLQGNQGVPQDLVDWLSPTLQVSTFLAQEPRAPDVIAVGFQELLPLHLGLSGLSGAVINRRDDLIRTELEKNAPNKERYTLVAKVVNVGIALLVYALDDTIGRKVTDVQTAWTGCGPMFMGNKGAVGVRFRVPEGDAPGEVYTFVCAHLTAFDEKLKQRVRDYHYIVGSLLFPPTPESPAGESTTIYNTSHLFYVGDLNFRVVLPDDHPHRKAHQNGEFAQVIESQDERARLKDHDQLTQIRSNKTAFVGLREGQFWNFKCSYKYKLGEVDHYSTARMPSWTDRVLYATYTDSPDEPERSNIDNILYTSIPSYTTSDHKPVVCLLLLPKSVPSPKDSPPLLKLPEGYKPTVDRRATVKRYIGRSLDRLVGLVLCLLTIVGVGSPRLGLANFVLGLGTWTWWARR